MVDICENCGQPIHRNRYMLHGWIHDHGRALCDRSPGPYAKPKAER